MSKKPKVIVIVGPTASGKTALSVHLAKKFGGEIISADSRQVYRGLDIGTEKIRPSEMKGIPHHLLDVAHPTKTFSALQFQKKGSKALKEILRRAKIPIIAGGTGFYINALLEETNFPAATPNPALRKKLESLSTSELAQLLFSRDAVRAQTIDTANRRRLIRALEIAEQLGSVPPLTHQKSPYDTLWIGLDMKDEILKKRISTRLEHAFKRGLVAEVKRIKEKLPWKRINELGLEYRLVGQFLRGELTKEELEEQLNTQLWHYVKRQRTWFKKNRRIRWFTPQQTQTIEKVVTTFLF
jgi:tRNA dimethylallyltransferase